MAVASKTIKNSGRGRRWGRSNGDFHRLVRFNVDGAPREDFLVLGVGPDGDLPFPGGNISKDDGGSGVRFFCGNSPAELLAMVLDQPDGYQG